MTISRPRSGGFFFGIEFFEIEFRPRFPGVK